MTLFYKTEMDGIPRILKRYVLGSMVYGGLHATYFGTTVSSKPEVNRVTAGKILAGAVVTSLASPLLLPVILIEGVDYVDKRFVLKLPMENETPPLPYANLRFSDDRSM